MSEKPCGFDSQSYKCKDCDEWGNCALRHPEQFDPPKESGRRVHIFRDKDNILRVEPEVEKP